MLAYILTFTSIKIDGVVHEFSTVPNVVEDVSEIIVNLKGVRFKSYDKIIYFPYWCKYWVDR